MAASEHNSNLCGTDRKWARQCWTWNINGQATIALQFSHFSSPWSHYALIAQPWDDMSNKQVVHNSVAWYITRSQCIFPCNINIACWLWYRHVAAYCNTVHIALIGPILFIFIYFLFSLDFPSTNLARCLIT